MRSIAYPASKIGILALSLACSISSVALDELGNTKPTLTATNLSGDVKVRVQVEPIGERSARSKRSWISSVEINVDKADIHVPRSAFADLIDPRQVKVEFKDASGAMSIEGGDGAEVYVA